MVTVHRQSVRVFAPHIVRRALAAWSLVLGLAWSLPAVAVPAHGHSEIGGTASAARSRRMRTSSHRAASRRRRPRGRASSRERIWPGARHALSLFASDHLPVGVVTNNNAERVVAGDARLGADGLFTAVIGARDSEGRFIRPPKPAATMLLDLAERFQLAPTQMVMIGDGQADIQAGKAAGMFTIGLCEGSCTRSEMAAEQPDLLVAHFGEVPAAVSRLRARGADIRGIAVDRDGTYIDAWGPYATAVLGALAELGHPSTMRSLEHRLQRRPFSARHDTLVPAAERERFKTAFERLYNAQRAGGER